MQLYPDQARTILKAREALERAIDMRPIILAPSLSLIAVKATGRPRVAAGQV
jgi:hypothetical protein